MRALALRGFLERNTDKKMTDEDWFIFQKNMKGMTVTELIKFYKKVCNPKSN